MKFISVIFKGSALAIPALVDIAFASTDVIKETDFSSKGLSQSMKGNM